MARLRRAGRPVYIYYRLLSQQVKSIVAYEADFVVLLFSAVIVQIGGLAVIWAIFQRIPAINGWTMWEVVMMYALIFVTEGVGSLFFEGTWRLGGLVYRGEFDRLLVRPVSPILQVLAGAVGMNGVGNIVTGGVLIAVSLAHVSVEWTPGRVAMLVILLGSAATIRVAVNLATAASAFWTRSPWNSMSMLVHQLGEFAKYPLTIYSVGVQLMIVVAVPFAFVSFFPTAFVFRGDAWSVAGLLTPLVAAYCMAVAVFIFNRGLRRYEGAGN